MDDQTPEHQTPEHQTPEHPTSESPMPATQTSGTQTPEHQTPGIPAPHAYQPPIATATATDTAPRPGWFRRHRRAVAVAGVAALCLGFGGAGGAVVALQRQTAEASYASPFDGGARGWSAGPEGSGTGSGAGGQGTSSGSGTSSGATTATAAQLKGVVTITTTVQYGQGEAAGTGMILTSSGEVLTNNHVVEGATAIQVTVESTGKTYTADVVGTDATDDVALLQLEDASGLSTVTTDTDGASVGDTVTDVGNAEGTGTLVAADGTITATDQQITVQDELTGASKSLDGLLQLDADVVSGDSGGPILDSEGEVVGIATAASSGSQNVTGFAIPIQDALAVVAQIRSGVATDTVRIGLPAFLGVELSSSQTASGATISGAVDGSAAASAGLGAGDTITAVDGTAISSADDLSSVIAAHDPGDSIQVTYTDAGGATATVTVTLGSGPAA